MKKLGIVVSLLAFSIFLVGCNNKESATPNKPIGDESDGNKIVDENGWFYLPISECYDDNGKLNRNPDIDDAGNTINCFNIRGEQNGKRVLNYYNGQIWMEQNFKDGKQDGTFIEYSENGNVTSKIFYKNGKANGKYVQYYDNGQLMFEVNYINGMEEDGKHVEYYDNGQIMVEMEYKGGKSNGKYIHYYNNGQIKEIGTMENGNPKGKREEYSVDGEFLTGYIFKS